ncbi:hypothetical protein DRQ36_06725 [bacterium]|nr:MAG: hypothetical protein DRQ36_06725 [bacterium]
MKPRKPIIKSWRAERFVASLLASLTLGHITADKMEIKDFPELSSATSFIRKPLLKTNLLELSQS